MLANKFNLMPLIQLSNIC